MNVTKFELACQPQPKPYSNDYSKLYRKYCWHIAKFIPDEHGNKIDINYIHFGASKVSKSIQ